MSHVFWHWLISKSCDGPLMMMVRETLCFITPEQFIKAALQILLFDEECIEFWGQKIMQRKQKSSLKLLVDILEYFTAFLLAVSTSVRFHFS
jgi:hypothetical protein